MDRDAFFQSLIGALVERRVELWRWLAPQPAHDQATHQVAMAVMHLDAVIGLLKGARSELANGG